MSLKIDEILAAATQAGITADKLKVLRQELEELEKEKADDRAANKGPKAKNQFVVVVKTDADMKDKQIVSTIFQIPEGDNPHNLFTKISNSVKSHNNASKRKKTIVSTFEDAIRFVKRKWSKQENYLVKTKDWVHTIVLTDDKIV